MTGSCLRSGADGQQGFSYVEVLVATVLIMISIVPALEALQTAILASSVHQSERGRHRWLSDKMEEVLAQPFDDLAFQEADAGGDPTIYSDAQASPDRRLVYLSRYDGDNADGDDDPLTDTDDGLLWVGVEIKATSHAVESLVAR